MSLIYLTKKEKLFLNKLYDKLDHAFLNKPMTIDTHNSLKQMLNQAYEEAQKLNLFSIFDEFDYVFDKGRIRIELVTSLLTDTNIVSLDEDEENK